MNGRKFTAQDAQVIFNMKHKGYSFAEIADELKRSQASIRSFLHRYRQPDEVALARRAEQEEKNKLPNLDLAFDQIQDAAPGFVEEPVVDEVVDNQVIQHSDADYPAEWDIKVVEPVKEEPKPAPKPEIKFVFRPLSDYAAIDLMQNLYDRGYRIEDNGLVQITKRKVLLNDVIKK